MTRAAAAKETVDAPGGGEARGAEETDIIARARRDAGGARRRVADALQPQSETVDVPGGGEARRRVRRATSGERGGAIPRKRRAPAWVTILQPRSETVDAPGGGEASGVE